MNALRVGIVGGAGQVGSALLKVFAADRGLSAVAICRNNVSATRLACQGMQVRIARTDNAAELSEATRDLDVIVNCALPLSGPSGTSAANHTLANSLAAACTGQHLVHLSSIAVYGEFIRDRRWLFDSPKPDSTYGRQKLQMEVLLQRLAKRHSMQCTILRVGHVYGAELHWSEVFFELIRSCEFRLPFDGQLASNAISISNLIVAVRELLFCAAPPSIVNVTDHPQISWRDLFDLHARASGCGPVGSLNTVESERWFRKYKKWADTGMWGRLASQTSVWLRQLPGSYLASVPVLKDMAACALQRIGSEAFEAWLRAFYWKHFASWDDDNMDNTIMPCFLSESMPGPHLAYQGRSPGEDVAALQAWHHAISAPQARASLAECGNGQSNEGHQYLI